ncbi:MAG: S4 domain-containing protein, partial [Gammaproteobacteria bacterium]|nr:S4 domain-containing protein [Gammaproteobacteria bacterium]
MSGNDETTIRLDKWLWAARFFKTRGLARTAIQAGKVTYNGQRSKPAKTVELNALINVPRGTDRLEVIVRQLSDQRRGAPEAQLLYEETPESVKKRE